MSDFHSELGRVLKYSRLRTQEEWLPLVEEYLNHHHRTGGGTDEQTPLVLADFLQDENDPRAEVLRRGAAFDNIHTNDQVRQQGYRERDDHVEEGPFGGLQFTVHRADNPKTTPAQKLVIGLEFPNASAQGYGIHRYVEGTPQEAHAIVQHLPDEQREAATEFLKRHFGEIG